MGSCKTPFLEYHLLQITGTPHATRTMRGYQSSLGVWEKIEELQRIAKEFRISDTSIKKGILAAGPCPGLWRVYYEATTRIDQDENLQLSEYLGNPIQGNITHRELGNFLDGWIDEANRRYNDFLDNESPECLDALLGVIGSHYRDRAKKHMDIANATQRKVCKLEVKPNIEILPSLPIFGLTPDGVFSGGDKAAIFETKLARPTYREFPHEMAVYAFGLEHARNIDVDYAVVLFSDYPDGHNLFTQKEPIMDSYVREVTSNLERFLKLAEIAAKDERFTLGGRVRSKMRLGFSSWKDFLRRPKNLPESDKRQHCPSCRHRSKCYSDGGEAP